MITDYHCHILPGIDDGAENVEMSLQMLEMLRNQGVERVVATPHFYAHREKSIEHFLEKRQRAYEKLAENPLPTEVILGAEVSIEHGISELKGIEKLAVSGTTLILLEPSYAGYSSWIPEEVHNISCDFRLTPLIAHIHRYIDIYNKSEMETMLEMDAIFQINNEAMGNHRERKFVKQLLKENYTLAFGSDSHNMGSRKPNFDLLIKKADAAAVDFSNGLYEEFSRKAAVI